MSADDRETSPVPEMSISRFFNGIHSHPIAQNTVGDNLFQEMINNYMYLQCNGDLKVYGTRDR